MAINSDSNQSTTSNVKRCIQCGMLKSEEDFRLYTYAGKNKTNGRYRVCKTCEAINQSYRRAKAIVEEYFSADNVHVPYSSKIEQAKDTVTKIVALYEILQARGLRTPLQQGQSKEDTPDDIDKLLAFYETVPVLRPVITPATQVIQTIPAELQEWLDVPTETWREQDISPEYLQETIYESLKVKYRPMLRVDKDTFLPIYDDTYKAILNKILQRFDEYEESFQGGE